MPVVDVMASRIVSVPPDSSAVDAVRRMVEAGVGSVVVTDGSRLQGIFTERDVLRLVADGADLAIPVSEVMTRGVFTLDPDADVLEAAHLMAERRIRHAPVAQGDQLLGIVGIRDVMRVLLERATERGDADARDTARDLLRQPPVSS